MQAVAGDCELFVNTEMPLVLPDGSTQHLTHFIVWAEARWQLVCMPHVTILHATAQRPFAYARSEDTRAITCPTCKATEVFHKAEAAMRV